MKQKKLTTGIGLVGLGSVGYMILNQLVKSSQDYSVKLIGRQKATLQFKKIFNQKNIEFCSSYRSFLSSPTPKIILLAIPNPIDDTIQSIANHLSPQTPTTLILLQNGVNATDVAIKILTPEKFPLLTIIRGCVTNASSRNSFQDKLPANYDPQKLSIALSPIDKNSSIQSVTNFLKEIGFSVEIIKNQDSVQWSKLISANLCGLSAAVVFEPLKVVLNDNDLLKFEINALKERLKVMRAAKINIINLPGFNTGTIAQFATHLPTFILVHSKKLIQRSNLSPRSNTMPSTAKKLLSGRSTEVEHYLKPVIDLAAKHQVAVPLTTKLYQTIKSIESGKIKPWTLSLADRKKLIL